MSTKSVSVALEVVGVGGRESDLDRPVDKLVDQSESDRC